MMSPIFMRARWVLEEAALVVVIAAPNTSELVIFSDI